ncbi:unnamed protein product [Fusarium graminearum]|uniref:Chromosome 1, complete genome n=1 Tax=Gibberella zeae (strain ATCC MYA-4620 / CBS 123657 / FGSC 9075 / NRRL 31084 / PH-1) TaxID=229533 RepID=A0A098D489_GIBZE|nr:unnamed protein product [Fusarium graminearum]CZS76028.1 unnamed protein product [Fusarium graminearum]
MTILMFLSLSLIKAGRCEGYKFPRFLPDQTLPSKTLHSQMLICQLNKLL